MERRLFPKVSNLQENSIQTIAFTLFYVVRSWRHGARGSFEITQEARLALGDASSNFPAALKTSLLLSKLPCCSQNFPYIGHERVPTYEPNVNSK